MHVRQNPLQAQRVASFLLQRLREQAHLEVREDYQASRFTEAEGLIGRKAHFVGTVASASISSLPPGSIFPATLKTHDRGPLWRALNSHPQPLRFL
jgi:hypothetical protein